VELLWEKLPPRLLEPLKLREPPQAKASEVVRMKTAQAAVAKMRDLVNIG
jgi:hypothetical protein